ncbi:MAG: hypothetical protein ACLR0U_30965 [Enterocloster clostridioformis]
MIAFADTTYEDSLRNGVVKYGAAGLCGYLAGILRAVYFFPGGPWKPVEESVRMQKQFVADASTS